jgi:hypothetical protein
MQRIGAGPASGATASEFGFTDVADALELLKSKRKRRST